MAGKVAPVNCPKCGGPMWDNIEGKRNPKAPDYACKDKQGCGAGVWLKDAEKAALAAPPAAAAPVQGQPQGQPARPPIVLDKMMRACVQAAIAIGNELFKDGDVVGLDDALTLNMATTMFIARCRGEGILELEKKILADMKAKAEAARLEAEQKKREEEERARQAAQQQPPMDGPPPMDPEWGYGGDDLPF